MMTGPFVLDLNLLIPRLQEALLRRGTKIPSWRASSEERQGFQYAVLRTLAEEDMVSSSIVSEVAHDLASRLLGLGILEPYLRVEGIQEIIVRNGYVEIEREGIIESLGILASNEYFLALAQRVAEMSGKPLRAANPFVLVDLPDGSRFTAMIPPLSHNGTAINIRVFARRVFTLDSLVKSGMLTPGMAELLAQTVADMQTSILVSGKPGAGKTTLLNALLHELPREAQLCVVETFEEMSVPQPQAARAVVREDVQEGHVSMREVVNVLYTRMRPDVLVVGEVVSDEAQEFLQAINLGVMALTTIHGNSVLDALHRLESLSLQPNVPLLAVRERIARGIGLGIHVDKDREGRRRVREAYAIRGLDGDRFQLEPLLSGARGKA